MKLSGLGVALVTPFTSSLQVDFPALEKLIEYNITGGTDFLVALGTTAEAATLSAEEKKNVVDFIVKINNNRLPLVLGIGGNNTMEVFDSINYTDTSAFNAILSVSPYYNRPSQEGLYQHYKQLAKSGKPIIMYNVPSRTGQNMEAATTLRLAEEFPNLCIIKEAAPNILQYFDILRKKPKNFQLLSGDDEYTLPVSLAGGDGVISVVGQAFPEQFKTMLQLAKENRVQEAYAIHNNLVEITRLIFSEGNPAGIKELLHQLNIMENSVRLPLVAASQTLQESISKCLQENNLKP